MKNKKGFTLIELLAVIVVLAIIALIATPIVMNTIKNAKKGAAERSADNYIKQVETAVAESRIDGTKIANGTYNIQPDGNLCPVSGCGENDKDKITIDISGTKPTSGTVTISNGEVSSTDTTMTVGDYDIKYNQEKNKYEASDKENTSSTTIVYRRSEDYINIGDTLDLSDTSKFTKDASTLGKSVYLKHVLDKDNKVTESYACGILKGKEYCLTAYGVEYGWSENEEDYTGNALILKKLKDAKIEGISCYFNPTDVNCYDDSANLRADSGDGGYVVVLDNAVGGGCSVMADGRSYCLD